MKTIWQSYGTESREQYVQSIKALGALSALFRQKATGVEDKTAYISSKYQETLFARFFNGTVVDRGNDPYDVMLPSSITGKRDLVGIKTFLNSSSSMQKIMQFKSVATEEGWSVWIKNGEYQKLVARISSLRNQKLRSTQNLLAGAGTCPEDAFANIFYHYLSPSKSGTVYVGESDYSFMDEENLVYKTPNESKRIASVYFTDGKHEYKYTPADSTLYMRFMHTSHVQDGGEIVDEFEVEQLQDPHASLMQMIKVDIAESIPAPLTGTKGLETAPSKDWTAERPISKAPLDSLPNVSLAHGTSSSSTRSLPDLIPGREQSPLGTNDGDEGKDAFGADSIFVFPIFRLSKYGETPAGEVDAKSGLNVRRGAPKNRGSETRRPVNEVEIKIPEPHAFHEMFPEFFGLHETGHGISKVRKVGGKWKSFFENKNDRTFELVLTQSGVSMDAIITGDGNKQIMSKHSQETLGSWILSQVFQLDAYEQLNRKKLDELEIDCIRLTKLGNRCVGIEFIKAAETDLDYLWPKRQEDFLKLSDVSLTEEV